MDYANRLQKLFVTDIVDYVVEAFDHPFRFSAHVTGYKLDNAHGDHVGARAIVAGYQEFVVMLETFAAKNAPGIMARSGFREEKMNVASMLAEIRMYNLKSSFANDEDNLELVQLRDAIEEVARGASVDMHEPDQQDITMNVMGQGYNTHHVEDGNLVFVLKKNRLQVQFTIIELITLMVNLNVHSKRV